MDLAGVVRETCKQCDSETDIDACNHVYVYDSPEDAPVGEAGGGLEFQ